MNVWCAERRVSCERLYYATQGTKTAKPRCCHGAAYAQSPAGQRIRPASFSATQRRSAIAGPHKATYVSWLFSSLIYSHISRAAESDLCFILHAIS